MTHRRDVLAVLGAGALLAPLPTFPQQAGRVWRVGILPGGPMAPRLFQWDVFRARMRELGYVEGTNVRYEVRAPEKEGAAYDELAADLVRANVDVIVATATTPITAARRATSRIPIVMCPSIDAIGEGFTNSLRRPDGNITGISIQSWETTGKRMQQVRELLPKATRLALITFPTSRKELEAAEDAARKLGFQLQSFEVGTMEAQPAAFEAAAKARAEAVMVASSALAVGSRVQLAALALKHRLPSSFVLPANAVAGGLMAYGPSDTEYYRQAAVFVDKLIKGAKVADLPIEQPTHFELVINLTTARTLGLTMPQSLLLQSRVIE